MYVCVYSYGLTIYITTPVCVCKKLDDCYASGSWVRTACHMACQAARRKHSAYLFVDDCHASGFLGAGGRGTEEHCGLSGAVDILNSTLGKALGGATGVRRRLAAVLRLDQAL